MQEVSIKDLAKLLGNIINNSISNSSCTSVLEVPAETTNSQARFKNTYKYTRTEGSKICDTYILQLQKGSSSAVQIDSQPALAYLVKMGGARNLPMIQEAKEIWEFCSVNQITLTAEYLPETLNTRADKASREMNKSSSEWILNKPIFKKMIQALGPVDKDMFASRLCHQIPKYISWQPDPHAWMVDAF